jgi:hypothetical protein
MNSVLFVETKDKNPSQSLNKSSEKIRFEKQQHTFKNSDWVENIRMEKLDWKLYNKSFFRI